MSTLGSTWNLTEGDNVSDSLLSKMFANPYVLATKLHASACHFVLGILEYAPAVVGC
jgi:hypothetical protein